MPPIVADDRLAVTNASVPGKRVGENPAKRRRTIVATSPTPTRGGDPVKTIIFVSVASVDPSIDRTRPPLSDTKRCEREDDIRARFIIERVDPCANARQYR